MDYRVMAVWKEGNSDPDTTWRDQETGLSRERAIARMVRSAMRLDEAAGEALLVEILTGRADPEKPHRIRGDESDVYPWVCIVREGTEPPVLPAS